MDNEMRIQTDQEFELSKVKRLNKKCKVHMFSLKVHGSKAFAAEQIESKSVNSRKFKEEYNFHRL